jgi:hypothetical protein
MTWLTLAIAAQLVIPTVPPTDLPKPEPAKPVVEAPKKLEYTGQPLSVPLECTDRRGHPRARAGLHA